MDQLALFGWEHYQHFGSKYLTPEQDPGRVISIRGIHFLLITEKGELESELTGRQLYSLSKEEQPKVGDWVTFMDYGSQAFILEVLPRKNELSRRTPGSESGRQVIAANIDMIFIEN